MPLKSGSSQKTISQNIRTEMSLELITSSVPSEPAPTKFNIPIPSSISLPTRPLDVKNDEVILVVQHQGHSLLAMYLEDCEFGASVLNQAGLTVVYEDELLR